MQARRMSLEIGKSLVHLPDRRGIDSSRRQRVVYPNSRKALGSQNPQIVGNVILAP